MNSGGTDSNRARLLSSPRAADRAAACVEALASGGSTSPALVVGATTEAAGEVIRRATLRVGSSLGWHRATLHRLAAEVARPRLASLDRAPASPLAVEAVCTRVVASLAEAGALGRFTPVGDMPGLPRALARTLQELRLAETDPASLPVDLRCMLEGFEAALAEVGLADRAEVLRLAAQAVGEGAPGPWVGLRTVLLDVPVASRAEVRLLAALAARAPTVLATCPDGDQRSLRGLAEALGVPARPLECAPEDPLRRLQVHLFSPEAPSEGDLGGAVTLVSAPGESRECVEITRRIHREAEGGVPFDRMAVLLHGSAPYRPHVVEALRRADVPAWYARGTRAPDPAGRGLLALLACRAEGLSARRFAEYLSLGEVPDLEPDGAPPPAEPVADLFAPPDEEMVPEALARSQEEIEAIVAEAPPSPSRTGGTLQAPRAWEQILVDAAVIGGLDRWARRLAGWRRELETQREHLDPGDPREESLARQMARVDHLRAFALPLLQTLQGLPDEALWGEWLDALAALASRALRHPERALSLLSELRPMTAVGPVGLDEVRLVLRQRLSELVERGAHRRYGRVFVGPVDAARGLDFDVVFIPGLAERLFPEKVVEDPMLLDAERAHLPGLERREERVAAQRLSLRLAVGAATERVVLSWPRVDVDHARPRVPSFYGLEVLRAAEGALPGFEELMRRAEQSAAARLGWPAPADPADAIDDAEHDLSLLHKVFKEGGRPGAARYLLEANPHLARALRARQRRWRVNRLTEADGLVDPRPEALAALAPHQLSARSYSPTALQHFAACPYRFLLQAVHRLQPREEPVAIEHIDALSRGSLIHDVQFELLTELRAEGALPVGVATLPAALGRLDVVLDRVAGRYRDDLAPAIPRVWDDGVDRIRADLREWLRQEADEPDWVPWRFELAFGLPWQEGRDEHSRPEAVQLDEGMLLRGSIDLVEQNATGRVRVTDYKTGKAWVKAGAIVDGGTALQPVLYALVAEKLFGGHKVVSGRLYYCTQRGGYEERVIDLDDEARRLAALVSRTVGERLAKGAFPAWPAEDACKYCDYLAVCGPREQERIQRKEHATAEMADLAYLRSQP